MRYWPSKIITIRRKYNSSSIKDEGKMLSETQLIDCKSLNRTNYTNESLMDVPPAQDSDGEEKKWTVIKSIFTARCTLVQSAVLRSHVVCLSVCPSVTLVGCDHIGWNSSKIISPLVSLGCSLFTTPTWRVCSKGNTPKFGHKVTHPLLIWASETFDRKLRPNG